VRVTPADGPEITMPWRADRTSKSGYFAQTGTAIFERPAPVD
jgi:hypothetical protein